MFRQFEYIHKCPESSSKKKEKWSLLKHAQTNLNMKANEYKKGVHGEYLISNKGRIINPDKRIMLHRILPSGDHVVDISDYNVICVDDAIRQTFTRNRPHVPYTEVILKSCEREVYDMIVAGRSIHEITTYRDTKMSTTLSIIGRIASSGRLNRMRVLQNVIPYEIIRNVINMFEEHEEECTGSLYQFYQCMLDTCSETTKKLILSTPHVLDYVSICRKVCLNVYSHKKIEEDREIL